MIKSSGTILVPLAIVTFQALAAGLLFFVYGDDYDTAIGFTAFSAFGSCAALSVWIQSRARRAFDSALRGGHALYIGYDAVRIAPGCPQRWLVALHVQFDGLLVLN